jgi:cytochrome oxidase Cu insertion factor (SCO1/SenC/PrrC family)
VVIISVLVAGLVLAALFTLLAVRVRQHERSVSLRRPSGIPASVSASLASLMGLSPVPASAAPGFTLTDQAGRSLSLASFRGRVVVLEFMDPHCTDICPIVSQEFIDAYRELGGKASQVVFAAVNVNRYHLRVADVAAFSREQQLTRVPSWHFLTGSYPSLRAVWHGYGVTVDAPSRSADVIHSSFVYFIDPRGRERYLANPMADHTASGSSYLPAGQIASWAHGIALVARQLAS